MSRILALFMSLLCVALIDHGSSYAQSADEILYAAKRKSEQAMPFQGDVSLLRPFESEWNNNVRLVFEETYGGQFSFPPSTQQPVFNPTGLASLLDNNQAMDLLRQPEQEELLREILQRAKSGNSALADVDFDSALAVWANSKGQLSPELIERASRGDVNVMFCLWLIWCGNGPVPK